jgi:regulator of sirC expression with transglutaminase-like and TPR domain
MTTEHPLVSLLRTDDPPVELAALLVAWDARRTLDVEAELRALDDLAAPLRGLGARSADARQAALGLAGHLHGALGFRGNREDYYDPRNSYLDQVIARRAGIPLSLAVLYLAIARRAGVPAEGVGFPGHFLVRVGGPGGVYQDPFNGGAVLDEADLGDLGRRFLGGRAVGPEHLAIASTASVVVRMLSNLQVAHAKRGDHAAALLVCDRLVEITDEPSRRRDRGMHALALRAYEVAIDDLEAYLRARPASPDRARVLEALRIARRHAGRPAN